MDKFASSKIMTDRHTVQGRNAKDTHTHTTTERTATKSGNWRGPLAVGVGSLLAISSLAAGHAQEIHDVPTAPMRDSHGTALGLRGGWHPLLERGIASSSDSLRQHENTGHSELPRLQVDTNNIEDILQDKKFREDILSLCPKPEFHKFLGNLAKQQGIMDSVRPMLQDENLAKCVSDLCRKPEFVKALDLLTKNKQFMESTHSLRNDKLFKHNVAAALGECSGSIASGSKPEDIGSKDTTSDGDNHSQVSRSSRKLLSDNRKKASPDPTFRRYYWESASEASGSDYRDDHNPSFARQLGTDDHVNYRVVSESLDRQKTSMVTYDKLSQVVAAGFFTVAGVAITYLIAVSNLKAWQRGQELKALRQEHKARDSQTIATQGEKQKEYHEKYSNMKTSFKNEITKQETLLNDQRKQHKKAIAEKDKTIAKLLQDLENSKKELLGLERSSHSKLYRDQSPEKPKSIKWPS